jgi:hypothetical protein
MRPRWKENVYAGLGDAGVEEVIVLVLLLEALENSSSISSST